MPSSKGSSNSNKTAHVMNLLRKNSPAPSVAQAPAPEQPTPAPAASVPPVSPAPQPVPQTAPIITALNADNEISLQIRDALTDELAREEENQASALPVGEGPESSLAEKLSTEPLEPEAAMPKAPEAAIPKVPEVPEVPVSTQAEIKTDSVFPVIEPTVSAPEPRPIADDTPAPNPNGEPALVNVMHRILEEKADKYLQMFDVCQCPQCRMDVMALALNQLPPMYVVLTPAELMLKSDMYEVRYNCEISAQLMRACKYVKQHPNHKM